MLVLSFLGKEPEKIPNLDIQPSRRVGPDWAGLGWAGLEGARGRRRVYMKKTALISLFAFGGWVLIPGAESLIPDEPCVSAPYGSRAPAYLARTGPWS